MSFYNDQVALSDQIDTTIGYTVVSVKTLIRKGELYIVRSQETTDSKMVSSQRKISLRSITINVKVGQNFLELLHANRYPQ